MFASEEFFLQLLSFVELHALVAELRLEAQGVGADLAGDELLAGRSSGDVVTVEELVAGFLATRACLAVVFGATSGFGKLSPDHCLAGCPNGILLHTLA